MAATGKTPILLYGSTTATNQPSAGNLTNSSDGCEIAINVADKNLFFKDATNTVNTVPIRQSSASSNGWLSSTDWSTFNSKQPAGTYVTSVSGTSPIASSGGTTPTISLGTVPIANGGTNNTSFTAKSGNVAGLVFYDGTKLANDATVTDVGYDTSAKRFYAKSISLTDDVDRYTEYVYNNKSSGFNSALLWLRSDQNTTNDTFRAISYYNGGVNAYKFYVTDAGQVWTADNVVIGTSGKGIDFSATAGTGTSELLADYEEGTWTPTIIGTTTTGTASYGLQSATYTKIGRMVYFECELNWNSGTGTGYLRIAGLPYTCAASNCAVSIGDIENVALTASYTAGAYVAANSTQVIIREFAVGGGGNNPVTYDAAGILRIGGCYYV